MESGGTSLRLEPCGLPVPLQQLCDALGWMVGNAREGVSEPGVRIDVVEFAGLDERVVDGRAPSS